MNINPSFKRLSQSVTLPKGRTIVIRNAKPNDQAYVGRTWVASASNGHVELRHGMRETNALVDDLLDDASTKILIACEPMNHDRIIGWIAYACGLVRVLLYVNVRNEDRRQGIGAALMKRAELLDSSTPLAYLWEGPSASWMKSKRPNAVHMTPQEYLDA